MIGYYEEDIKHILIARFMMNSSFIKVTLNGRTSL